MSSSSELGGATSRVLRGTRATAVRQAVLGRELQCAELAPLNAVAQARLDAAIEGARRSGYDDGYRAGHAAGAAAAEAEALVARAASVRSVEALLAALGRAADELRSHARTALGDVDGTIVSGAFDLATAIVGRELAVASDPGRDALVRALAAGRTDGTVTVRLHPADFDTLCDADTTTAGIDVRLLPDPVVERGGAVAQGEGWAVDAQLGPAIERARRILFPEGDPDERAHP